MRLIRYSFFVTLLTGFLFGSSALSATSDSASPLPATENISEYRDEAVQALIKRLHSIEKEIKLTRDTLREQVSEDEKRELFAELKSLEGKLNETKLEIFEIVAPRLDIDALKTIDDTPFTLRGAIEDVIRPLIADFKRVTADSREAQIIRDKYNDTKIQSEILTIGLEKLKQNIEQTPDAELKKNLQRIQEHFSKRLEKTNNELDILAFRINAINSEQRSFVGQTTGLLESFFRQRGKNLIFAVLAAALTFFLLNLLHSYLHRSTKLFSQGRSFGIRLLDIGLSILSFLGALFVAASVLISFGDWVLLGLFSLLLFGVLITLRDSIPSYLNEIRLILNIGVVREGERIVINNVPWIIEKLSFFSILRNPALNNGTLRIPISSLTDRLSHPETANEPFFPSNEGDWVQLDDEVYGRVTFQNVETVRLTLLGGTLKTYTTENFLNLNPQNFSHNFRVKTVIGIDYKNQPESTSKTLEQLREFFSREIYKEVAHEEILSLKVEFRQASASSLDYNAQVDVVGSLAPRRFVIERMLQRIGVDACNKFDLGIPFQQITLHKAEAASESSTAQA